MTLLINISRKQAYFYAAFFVLYEFLTYIANDMVMPAMIQVVDQFKAPETAIATSLTVYILGGASLQVVLGPLSDRFGRRPVLLFGVIFFFLCSVFIAFSGSINQFLMARYFQGMGLCFISVVGYAVVQEIFNEMDAIRLISIMANVAVIAPLIGPLVGALFIYYFDWRLIFGCISLGTAVSYWGLWRFMPESVAKHSQPVTQRFALRNILADYKALLSNPTFFFGSLALGVSSIPCLVWIALSPIIIMTEGKLSPIHYGLWQIPVFGAYILGNMVLHRLTHQLTVKTLILVGSGIMVVSLPFTFLLPVIKGLSFYWLMPGLIVYFLGLGIVSAPLNRFILFSTTIGKGTATALESLIHMGVLGLGIELGNIVYWQHSNLLLGLYNLVLAVLYALFLFGSLYTNKKSKQSGS